MLRKISTIDFKSSNTTSGKTVLIRVDYNVPVENELVTDDYRILKSIPTIKYCLDQGAKVVLMSHMGSCLLYTSPSPRDLTASRMPSSA